MKRFRNYLSSESGAITVDWITLTAGIVLTGLAAIFTIYYSGATSVATGTDSTVDRSVAAVTLPDVDNFGG